MQHKKYDGIVHIKVVSTVFVVSDPLTVLAGPWGRLGKIKLV